MWCALWRGGSPVWQRFTLTDLRVIGHYLGTLAMFFGLLMLVPFVTAVYFQEWQPAARYLFSAGLVTAIGAALRFLRVESGRLNRRQALAITGTAWLVLAFFASIPLYHSGHFLTYSDALFDAVSGLTTTGASVLVDLDHLSYADNMFRFVMHFLGGLGLIVVALTVGLLGRQSSASLYNSEARSEHVVPNVVQTARFILRITLIVVACATAAVAVILLLIGMEPARAWTQGLWLSISGFLTGGFAPMAQSVLYYHCAPLEFVLMVLMIMGSVSFIIHSELWKGRIAPFFNDIETRTMFLWIGAMTIVFTASLATTQLFSDLPTLLRRGLFMVVSSFTTTGFQTITGNQLNTVLSSGAFLSLALLMAVGGATDSTAGGIKFMRLGVIFKSVVSTVKEALAPESARVVVSYNHLGRRVLTPSMVKTAMTVFILYVIFYVVGTLVGIAHGYEANEAIFESVAMTSNGGIVAGLVTPGMPVTLELFYMLQMWAGRLEFVTLLALAVEVVASIVPRRIPGRRE